MSQSSLKVATLRSLIDGGGRVWNSRGLEKISKTNNRGGGGWNSRKVWKKVKILIAGKRRGF